MVVTPLGFILNFVCGPCRYCMLLEYYSCAPIDFQGEALDWEICPSRPVQFAFQSEVAL